MDVPPDLARLCADIILCFLCSAFSISQWPRGRRRGSATDRLLGLRVRIPPGAWMHVLCVVQTRRKMQDNQDAVTLRVKN